MVWSGWGLYLLDVPTGHLIRQSPPKVGLVGGFTLEMRMVTKKARVQTKWGNMTAYTDTVGVTVTHVTRAFDPANRLIYRHPICRYHQLQLRDNGNLIQITPALQLA